MFSYTINELLRILKERYYPEEIVQILGITSPVLVNNLIDYIEENYEDVHTRIIGDEEDHFGLKYGEDNDE